MDFTISIYDQYDNRIRLVALRCSERDINLLAEGLRVLLGGTQTVVK